MTNVYSATIGDCGLFASPELVVQSLRLSYHKVALKLVPNAALTQVTIIFADENRANLTVQITTHPVHTTPQHL